MILAAKYGHEGAAGVRVVVLSEGLRPDFGAIRVVRDVEYPGLGHAQPARHLGP